MNATKKPFDDPRVRKAIRLACNKDELIKVCIRGHGQKVVLMSDACFNGVAKNLALVWDDQASGPIPANGDCSSGTYKPTDYPPAATLPSPSRRVKALSTAAMVRVEPNSRRQPCG